MANRQLIVQILGDSRSLERAFARSSRSSKTFGNDMERAGRGALAASLSFRGVGRAATFASAQFLGGAGIVFALKSITDQASRVQEETEKTGVVFGQNARQVQRWATTLSNSFGISEGAALEATGKFGNMLRPLGFAQDAAAKMSERLVTLAADLASFNNAKPDEVLQALSSGLAGQVRPLRQYGIFLSQTRIQQEAVADGISKTGKNLTQAQKVQAAYNIILKDSANAQGDVARNTESLSVAQSKFIASIQDVESRLGKGLLPVITGYLNKGSAWLSQTKNQERIQRDLTNAATAGVSAIKGLADAANLVRRVTEPLVSSLGGLQHTITIIALAATANRIRNLAESFGLLATKEKEAAVASTTLGGKLRGLPSRVLISFVIATEATGPLKRLFEEAGATFPELTDKGGEFRVKAGKIVTQMDGRVVIIGPDHKAYTPAEYRDKFGPAAIARSLGGDTGAFGQESTPKVTQRQIVQRNQFFDAGIARQEDLVQDIPTIQGQISALRIIASKIGDRLKVTKDVTRRLKLEADQRQVLREIRSDQKQVSDELTARLAESKRQAALREQARQFQSIGLGPTGGEIVPGIGNLRKQLDSLTQRLSGTKLNTTKLQSQLAGVRRVLTDQFRKATPETRSAINDLFKTIRDGLNQGAQSVDKTTGHLTAARKLNANAILGDLGLSGEQLRQARARLSHFTTASPVVARSAFPRAALAGVTDAGTEIILTVNIDGKPVEATVTKRQQVRRRQNPPQRVGRVQ